MQTKDSSEHTSTRGTEVCVMVSLSPTKFLDACKIFYTDRMESDRCYISMYKVARDCDSWKKENIYESCCK